MHMQTGDSDAMLGSPLLTLFNLLVPNAVLRLLSTRIGLLAVAMPKPWIQS